jgi:glycosyltransferase involved in cell wall biosynthesis
VKLVFAVDAIFPPLTGIGRYALELATLLPQCPELEDVRYLGMWHWAKLHAHVGSPPQKMADLQPPWWLAQFRRQMAQRVWAVEMYDAISDVWRGQVLKGARGAVYHSPNYFLAPHDGPSVATVHDLSITRYPDTHPRARRRYVELAFERSLLRASMLITDTEAVRQELLVDYGVAPEKVRAIHLGVSEHFRPMPPEATRNVLQAHGLTHGQYALSVATLEPRKKLDRLITAYGLLPSSVRSAYPLVLIGSMGWLNSPLQRQIEQAQSQGWLRFLGYVSQEDLPVLYAGARAYAMTSIYEGFGLPVLEAMASGVPVLTSSVSCMPEVAGGAALLVHPDDVDALTLQLQRLLTDDPWRAEAVPLGLARAKQMTWERCLAETIAVYREAANR